ncbi:amino acid adenylation domain-containing protein [Actinokineospora diospyrosa]|uniref:Amino acid adenylation domain-containing protein n=1 Tax=Actinokineospora diospyrosa TaxID=103728 RepID=A0ABT1I5W6_9PSEU|nr:amino acid adenylation domain-containing protein [Actinokineospora diospyrosa]MCP2268017.1 amino acid adenylation domain-containing protein [Actinokineospora diospyrosa]
MSGLLHELFAAAAAKWPDAVAVSDARRSLTYAELDTAANRLANRLAASGAGPETLVALSARRSVDLLVGVLGVLKAGAGYLPLDPRHPRARSRDAVLDSGARLVLADEDPGYGPAWVPLDPAAWADEPGTAPRTAAGEDNVAYVIYTSGSTGRPKGVVVSHRNVVRLFEVTEAAFGFGPDQVWTMFHSIAFDFSVWEIWGALLHGGQVVVVEHDISRDPAAFLDLLRAKGVTSLSQTPSAFRRLAAAAEEAGYPELPLRFVVFGGEKLEPSALRRWVEHYGVDAPRLVNMYGITETTVHVTIRDLTHADLAGTRSPIGVALPDLTTRLLDADLGPARRGELYVGGSGVARGYLNRPSLTASRFVPDPDGPPGSRRYRSGDLAEIADDGELLFHGREDGQVQLRGFRIETGEVEAAVLAHPGVREAVVLLREDDPEHPRLVCYHVPPAGSPPATDLRATVVDRLPEYMVPSAFVAVDELPMTVNGKLDRAALPAPVTERSTVDISGGTPAQRLAAIWADLLGVPSVGPEDNFFAIGGDSILVIPMVAEAAEAGLRFSVAEVFANPTVNGLLAAASPAPQEVEVALPWGDLSEGAPEDVVEVYPASSMQQGIIFHSKVSRDPRLYHDLLSVRLRGRLDLAALNTALNAVVAGHEVLRTSFDLGTHREVVQQVHESAPVEVVEVPDGDLRAWWAEQSGTPFDLTAAPLIRGHVMNHGDGEFTVMISTHHAVLDGWSFALVAQELITRYADALAGRASSVAPSPRYREFVVLDRLAGKDERSAAFWADLLDGVEQPRLDPPDPAAAKPGVDPDVVLTLPDAVVTGARELAGSTGVPLKSVYLAAHLAALGRLTDRKEVVSGLVVNGRPETPGAERTLGLFLNSVPVRVDLAGLSWPELVRQCFTAERDLFAHRRFPLAKMRKPGGGAPFGVLFNFTAFHALDSLSALDGVVPVRWWLSDRNDFGLSVEVGQVTAGSAWELTARVDPRHTTVAFGRRLAEEIVACLTEAVAS